VQWVTAGKGVIHSEIPQQEHGVMDGCQLWLNLPRGDKMKAPWYRDFSNEQLPQFVTPEGVQVTVIAGDSHGVTGAVTREATQPRYLDVHLPAGRQFQQTLAPHHNAFIYVYRGEVNIAGQSVPTQRMAILANDAASDGVIIQANIDTKLILISGQPLKEPIVQYGPFVMNTQQEIHEALRDFRDGRLAA